MAVVETDINKRWENGTPHHPKSEDLYKLIAATDYDYGDDDFCFKSGGDGDNGEHLMYLLDIIFEREEAEEKERIELLTSKTSKTIKDLNVGDLYFYQGMSWVVSKVTDSTVYLDCDNIGFSDKIELPRNLI